MLENSAGYLAALRDFDEARRRGALEAIMARLTGKSDELLSYEEVRGKLKAKGNINRGLQDIPLDAIVGSVGRYTDFRRSFLPKRASDQERWAQVKAKVTSMEGLPPIEVYQIGEAYFVRDGNHRVSVAREIGAQFIQAYVTEVRTRVPLSVDDEPDDVILKAEYADFLEHTHLDRLRPDANLTVTAPGRYRTIEEHIQVHHYFMGLEQQRDVPYDEAVTHWYDDVYLPVIRVIREQGILREFSNRTETDLYLWLAEHRAALRERLGWEVRPEAAATDLASQSSDRPERVVARVSGKILRAVRPNELESGPAPGEWRRERSGSQRDGRLFADILIPLNGDAKGWYAFEQAVEVARREGSQLRGLHVMPSRSDRREDRARAIQAEFNQRCAAAGIQGTLAIETGSVAYQICERNRWTDLIVVNLAYPPPLRPLARLSSGFRTMLRRCASPVLAVPGVVSPLNRALLAYDGSAKADEALFVATYLASRWNLDLSVLTVRDNGSIVPETLSWSREYLESHNIQATYHSKSGSVPAEILKTAEEQNSNLIIMGGYGHTAVIEVVVGSTVDHVLRASRQPTLICR
jgi:nucleotide-binding universal stress UspA family protein